jgi:hypothetical protein
MEENKYIVIHVSHDIEYKNERWKLKKECFIGLRLVLGTELSVNNKFKSVGPLAVPVLWYSFGIINWLLE